MKTSDTSFIRNLVQKTRKDYPLLTAQEELELGKKMCQGDSKARERLIMSNLGLIITIAGKINIPNSELEDLIQDGFEVLLEKVGDFDWKKNRRFSTFIWPWVWENITRKNNKLKNHDYTFMRKLENAKQLLGYEKGETPDLDELCDFLDMDKSKLIRNMQRISNAEEVSLESKAYGEDENSTLLDKNLNNPFATPEEELLQKESIQNLKSAIQELPQQERDVIMVRWYHDGEVSCKPESYRITGEKLGMSHENARHQEMLAIRHLKSMLSDEHNQFAA